MPEFVQRPKIPGGICVRSGIYAPYGVICTITEQNLPFLRSIIRFDSIDLLIFTHLGSFMNIFGHHGLN